LEDTNGAQDDSDASVFAQPNLLEIARSTIGEAAASSLLRALEESGETDETQDSFDASVFAQPHLPALVPPFSAATAVNPSPLAPEEHEEEEGFTTVSRRGPHEVGASPSLHVKCNGHHFCEDYFYGALELAIDRESSHPIPCG